MTGTSKRKVNINLRQKGRKPDRTLHAIIIKTLRSGRRANVTGLGVFEVRQMKSRIILNPQTGKHQRVAAHERIAFRPSLTLTEAVCK